MHWSILFLLHNAISLMPFFVSWLAIWVYPYKLLYLLSSSIDSIYILTNLISHCTSSNHNSICSITIIFCQFVRLYELPLCVGVLVWSYPDDWPFAYHHYHRKHCFFHSSNRSAQMMTIGDNIYMNICFLTPHHWTPLHFAPTRISSFSIFSMASKLSIFFFCLVPFDFPCGNRYLLTCTKKRSGLFPFLWLNAFRLTALKSSLKLQIIYEMQYCLFYGVCVSV